VLWETPINWQLLVLHWRDLFPTARVLTVAAGRQVGKTLTARRLAVEATTARARGAEDAVDYFVTPTYPLGRKPFRLVESMVRRTGLGTVNRGERIVDFVWGTQLQFRTAETPGDVVGETIRSLCTIDEAGRLADDTYDYLDPATRRHDAAQIRWGTPRGKNRFYDGYLRGLDANGESPLRTELEPVDERFVSISVPSWLAPELGWTPDAIAAYRARMSDRLFRQEIGAEFLEGAASLFGSFGLICVTDPENPMPEGVYIIGADVAKHEDFTALHVFRVDCRPPREVHTERFNQINWLDQKRQIYALCKRYNYGTLVLDSTGIGDVIYDDLSRLGLNIVPFRFTALSKSQLVENFVALVQTRQILLLKRLHAPVPHQEMSDFEYSVARPSPGVEAKFRYGAPTGKHDDTVIGRALACHGLGMGAALVVGVSI